MSDQDASLYCSIILWDLSRSSQTVRSLRNYLRDYAAESYETVPGLRQKVWISSTGSEGELWGAVYLWDSQEAAYGRPPGVSHVVELIGYRPTERRYFGVEAAATGLDSLVGALTAGVGMAFQSGSPEPLARPQEFVPPGADAFIQAGENPAGGPAVS
ncbi:YdhR family protein [Streptomyces sp. TRM76130]|nr:YdhR family protein [Streptomyces sp. TRM76130]